MGYLSNIFQKFLDKREAAREEEARLKLALEGIKLNDARLLQTVLAKGPLENGTDMLLGAAIRTDNVEIFNMVLAKQTNSNPNTRLAHREGDWCGIVMGQTVHPVIYSAILAGKQNIALYLAADPETDIMVPAGRTTTYCSGGMSGLGCVVTGEVLYSTPLEAAVAMNMPAVAQVLARRMAGPKAGPGFKP